MSKTFTIAGVSGSLRAASLNGLYLRALALACPAHINFHIYDKLGDIPAFNVDKDENPPEPVRHWKAFLAQSDMIILASPEYAHGISGVLKNALDWLVSDFQLLDRPLAFPNVSVRATIAQTHLEEVIRTMGFTLVDSCSPQASLERPLIKLDLSAEEIASDPILGRGLISFWQSVSEFLNEYKRE
jgi:chromate reductase